MKITPTHPFPPILCPAMRARMGDRWYYLATMTFAEIARAVQPVPDLPEKATLKDWIQRELRPERTAQIAHYLSSQSQRFFNALVLGVYGGDPEWQAVSVEERLKVKESELDERQANAFGMVHLSGEENIFAIDGQHRVEGIRAAVAVDKSVSEDEQAVIFIAHLPTKSGRERTRRIFSTLNTYARPVSERETVAISEDNAFAIATRRLIERYPGLDMEHVPLLPSTDIPANEKSCVVSVVGLYQMVQLLAPPAVRRTKRRHIDGPPTEEVVELLYNLTAHFWDALKRHFTPIRELCAGEASKEIAAQYRNREGGHLLFRPVGMKAFVRATRVLLDRGATMEQAVARLSKIPTDLRDDLWQGLLWREETHTILHKYGRLALNVILHYAGEGPDSKNYSVIEEFNRITGHRYPGKKR